MKLHGYKYPTFTPPPTFLVSPVSCLASVSVQFPVFSCRASTHSGAISTCVSFGQNTKSNDGMMMA